MKPIYPIVTLMVLLAAIALAMLTRQDAAAQTGFVTINGLAPVQDNLVCGQTFDVQINITNQGSAASVPGVVTLQSIHRGTGTVLFTGQATYPSIPPGGNFVVPMQVRLDRYISRGQELVATTNGQSFSAKYDIRQGNCSKDEGDPSGGNEPSYYIQARHSGKCLDVQGDNRNDGATIQQYSCHGSQNQQWALLSVGNGYYELVSRSSNKCLDIRGASRDDRVPAQLYSCHNGDNQEFQLQHVGTSYFYLVAKHSGKCLDVRGADTGDGAIVQQHSCNGQNNQQWQLR